MRRRDFLAGFAGAVVAPLAARAQHAANPHLAIFSPFEPAALMQPPNENRYYRALFDELGRLGHIEGKNLIVERYGREKSAIGLHALAAEVVSTKPDVVYVLGPGARFFKDAAD